ALERVAQRGAELGRARLALLRGLGDRVLQQQPGIVDAGPEDRRLLAELLLVGRDVLERDLLRRHVVGNLVQHQQQRTDDERALDLAAADLDERTRGRAVRVEDRALVAGVDELHVRQRR